MLLERHGLSRGAIASAARNLEIGAQLSGLRQIRDDELGVDDLDVVIANDVTGRNRARTLLHERKLGLLAAVHPDRDELEIEQDVDDVFLHALDARVLVQYALDLGLDDRGARHRR